MYDEHFALLIEEYRGMTSDNNLNKAVKLTKGMLNGMPYNLKKAEELLVQNILEYIL